MEVLGLSPQYNPKPVEDRWYAFWEENGLFHAEPRADRKPFSIVIPPPNITGILHMGHVLNNTLQDIVIRSKRMQGYETLWMPGTDHAGIGTQVVVERMLAKQGLSRHDIGRERFVEEVWKWREQYGRTIVIQLKRLGCSCDWARERFTMDEGLSRAVLTVFITLYRKGLIYRGHRIINWCPRCHTALSSEEAIPQEETGSLWVIRYPLREGGYIAVATTRPETMLGDSGVAVHPDDPRHAGLIAKTAILPLVGREIPVVADAELVDPAFGTGAVKVTPAHDPNDFIMGQRHDLAQIIVIGEDGRMTAQAGAAYAGMDRFECRKAVVAALEAQGLLEKVEPHTRAVPHCQRCDTTLEPLLSRQWFARMKPLAGRLLTALDQENIPRFTPDHWVKTYRHWLENIEDWCISRQLWWGHRIPVWYCTSCGKEHAAVSTPERCDTCGHDTLRQDENVLDTWFSSALWPFSTMGWPDDTAELRYFYPTSVLVTAHDILFFWVARMMMMGYEFMGDRPFADVYLNNLLRDTKGRKLSKSLGNSPDPLDVMDKYGVDALRFAITHIAPQGQDVYYDNERVEIGRHFANKLWNAGRFVLMNQTGRIEPLAGPEPEDDLWDRWILSRLAGATAHVNRAFDRYGFQEASHALYDFFWHDYCDWYLEIIKSRLYDRETASGRRAVQVALWTLERTLRLLHPYMPFITEELWSHTALFWPTSDPRPTSIMHAAWPEPIPAWIDPEVENQVLLLQSFTGAVREVRADFRIHPSKQMTVFYRTHAAWLEKALHSSQTAMERIASIRLHALSNGSVPPHGSVSRVLHDIEFFAPLADLIDIAAEIERLAKERERVLGELEKVVERLSNALFMERAPADVVEREHDKQRRYGDLLARLSDNLDMLVTSRS
ncbi:MAG: valine--tRNA ligase [candidate division Zixibacteria bacterium]|nr:valine--tRNA ligase [candidate division Zixibacteria bacterium]